MMVYCRKVVINKPECLSLKGPVLFAANHPNSFLDGIIMTTLMEEQLYSLARGDAFARKTVGNILRRMFLLPVYRTNEGKENLSQNYTTFEACQQVFATNGIVLIFSEGGSANEWHLRPLRKGTARLTTSTWEKGINLIIIPLGINYNAFRLFGKNVHINFGEPLNKQLIIEQETYGKQLLAFNEQLESQLRQLVYEVEPGNKAKLKSLFYVPLPMFKKIILAIPAFIGAILHLPLYISVKAVASLFSNDHYDSLVVALLMVEYPFYWLLIALLCTNFLGWIFALIIALSMPFCAWAYVQLKRQI
ncbi:1-acyl-sn-glycerol-3-phosphate acyltransferase [Chitinophagaceae bacterium LB-8]|uniref:1-acyl-sn-glycerol-3-phosphate acyltransferase n=1 Tax=Paraflavisolibacter caeni TaxID=2982496 RepID=A0A9X3B9S7_9BACT|nr:1-acyl-sn-glycerol-3-phosphate acyltransferase [Paraflavisolibacter caeni]MCU7552410.1 1-acyl-sn-glycerol-3-phosphate acyltransferase [Paraflavisolibacter caeni]